MRDWLFKPLLILAGLVTVLVGASALYVAELPRQAQAAGSASSSVHQRQVDQACQLVNER